MKMIIASLKASEMRTLSFTKMHGLGNDFVILNAFHHPIHLNTETIQQLGDRHRGIGFDQLLVVKPSTCAEAQFRYQIFNTDGSEAEQCGNGARCFARYVYDMKLTQDTSFTIETCNSKIICNILQNGDVSVAMNRPNFDPSSLPCILTPTPQGIYQLDVPGELSPSTLLHFYAVSMGNPHVIIQVPTIEEAPVKTLGAWLEKHPAFPKRVNVEFMEIINPYRIKMRVYERGAGETQACGSGACATAAVGFKHGFLDRNQEITVEMLGGSLRIKWEQDDMPLWMTGSATTVFHGEYYLSPSSNPL